MPESIYNHQSFKNRRRELRKNQTLSEKIVWDRIRGRQLEGYKFNRQYSAGPYILDFYCSKLRLAIEIDGSHHGESDEIVYDKEREKLLSFHKILTVRFWNNEILENTEKVLEKLRDVVKTRALEAPSLAIREGVERSDGMSYI